MVSKDLLKIEAEVQSYDFIELKNLIRSRVGGYAD